MEAKNLPRLLYIGDVPVESTVAGAALLYRLLQKYPASHLKIVEGNVAISQLDKRLPDVVYKPLYVGMKQLLYTRFVSLYTSYLFLSARLRTFQLTRIVNNYQPQAILTVAQGYSWLTAAALAERFKLPLHLIIHDDWPSSMAVLPWLQDAIHKQFGYVYRQAQSRLCISPYMVECYEKLYKVTGSVLYPSRAANVPEFEHPSDRHKQASSSLVFAYAGSIYFLAYARSLVLLASVLEKVDCSLVIYSSLTEESINHLGLNRRNVITRPLIPYQDLITTLRNEADVLFVPMSFDPKHHSNMEMSFPSKLTDYTTIGLPLLIWGPPYCSAVRWAQENAGVAEVVERESIETLEKAVKKLVGDPEYRFYLGDRALTKGREYFSHDTVLKQFYQFISSTTTELR